MPQVLHAHTSPDRSLRPFEPAMSQLRHLTRPDLDRVIADWLQRIGFESIRCVERRRATTTYQALLGSFPMAFPFAVRVIQRDNRLQAHHVEAFLGHLVRHGRPAGLLVTTTGCTREAIAIAARSGSPCVRLLSGPQWCHELMAKKVGLTRRQLPRWVVDLTRLSSWSIPTARRAAARQRRPLGRP